MIAFEYVTNYTIDRIYANAEMSGKPQNGIPQGIKELRTLLNCPDYNLCLDYDSQHNNPLHLIAKYGLFEFYDVIKTQGKFNCLKNQPNQDNLTPLDMAKIKYQLLTHSLASEMGNITALVTGMVTYSYYKNSYDKLILAMENDGLHTNHHVKTDVMSILNQKHNHPVIAEFIRQVQTSGESYDQLLRQRTEHIWKY